MEEKFKNDVLKELSPYFVISTENDFYGINPSSNKKLRIDAMIRPKDTTDWANKNIVFGIEFKDPKKLEALKDFDSFIRQCIDYSYCTWHFKNGEISRPPILMCPPIYGEYNGGEKAYPGRIINLINHWNIGELVVSNHNNEIEIRFSKTHTIWTSGRGVCEGNRWKFNSKIGSKR